LIADILKKTNNDVSIDLSFLIRPLALPAVRKNAYQEMLGSWIAAFILHKQELIMKGNGRISQIPNYKGR
jgi:hypothetical protein